MATEPEDWERYPADWSRDGESLELNAMDSLRRLEDPEGIYFLEEDDDINVRITDVNNSRY
jgi:hypothetical protein